MKDLLKVALVAPVEPYSPVTGPYAGTGLITHFRSLFELSGISHYLTTDYVEADLLLVLEPSIILDYRRYAKILTSLPYVRNHPEKCYTYNGVDRPWPILPGIYVSLPISQANRWLHCGGPHAHFENKHVKYVNSPTVADALIANRLGCFRGSPTSILRKKIYRAAGRGELPSTIKIERSFGSYFQNGEIGQQDYCKEIRDYAFSLAPKGYGQSTFRIYESMAIGRAPVIIADSWLPPKGIPWSKCSLIIPERDISDIGTLLAGESNRAISLGATAHHIYEANFSPTSVMKYIISVIGDIHGENPYPNDPSWRLNLIDKAALTAPSLPIAYKIVRTIRRIKRSLLTSRNSR